MRVFILLAVLVGCGVEAPSGDAPSGDAPSADAGTGSTPYAGPWWYECERVQSCPNSNAIRIIPDAACSTSLEKAKAEMLAKCLSNCRCEARCYRGTPC